MPVEHKGNRDGSCLARYAGDDRCTKCDGWGWRFPRIEHGDTVPTLDGIEHHQAQPCDACERTGIAEGHQ